MQLNQYKAIVEGLLFSAGTEGLTTKQLLSVLDLDIEVLTHIINELKFDYENADRGIIIVEFDNRLFLATKPDYANYFKMVYTTPQETKLSQAGLETLAIIAYNQPVTRTEIEEIRGVKSDRPIQTLLSRALIEEVGRKDSVGRPMMFGTSVDFLTYFGLKSIDELPPLTESVDDKDVTDEVDLFFDQINYKSPD